MPITENTIAINPVKICPLHTPIKPKMNARGDKMKDMAKTPTNPMITPLEPKFGILLDDNSLNWSIVEHAISSRFAELSQG